MNTDPLAPGTLLAPSGATATATHYRIGRVLGTGGFGITYLAEWMGAEVAIKEYLPSDFAARSHGGLTVTPRTGKQGELFHFGLERFEEEARTLLQLKDAPSIAKALNYFEANGTAYLVMDYVVGRTLEEVVRERGALPEQELRKLWMLLLQSLAIVHQRGYLHRDIKPSNIIVLADGQPLLMLSPGYAPFEQYNTSGSGPFTDLYALGATLYYCLLNIERRQITLTMSRAQAPDRVAALQRGEPDPLTPAVQVGAGRYSVALLEVLDWMLRIWPNERPQTAAQVLARLQEPGSLGASGSDARTVISPNARVQPAPPHPGSRSKLWLGIAAAAVVLIALVIGRQLRDTETSAGNTQVPPTALESSPTEIVSTTSDTAPPAVVSAPPPTAVTQTAAVATGSAPAATDRPASAVAAAKPPKQSSSAAAAPTQPAAVVVQLPTTPAVIESSQLPALLVQYDLFDRRRNPSGKGVAHRYRQQVIGSAVVVIDEATGLMWQKAASPSDQNTFPTLGSYIDELNRQRFAGHDDWRVPTVVEAMSLMEPAPVDEATPTNKKLLDPIFTGGNFIWTADTAAEDRGWLIYFYDGLAATERFAFNASVRAVRTEKAK